MNVKIEGLKILCSPVFLGEGGGDHAWFNNVIGNIVSLYSMN